MAFALQLQLQGGGGSWVQEGGGVRGGKVDALPVRGKLQALGDHSACVRLMAWACPGTQAHRPTRGSWPRSWPGRHCLPDGWMAD